MSALDSKLDATVTILDTNSVRGDNQRFGPDSCFTDGEDYLILGVRGMCDELVVVDNQGRVVCIEYSSDDSLMLIND